MEMVVTVFHALAMFVLIEEPFRKLGNLIAMKICLTKSKTYLKDQ